MIQNLTFLVYLKLKVLSPKGSITASLYSWLSDMDTLPVRTLGNQKPTCQPRWLRPLKVLIQTQWRKPGTNRSQLWKGNENPSSIRRINRNSTRCSRLVLVSKPASREPANTNWYLRPRSRRRRPHALPRTSNQRKWELMTNSAVNPTPVAVQVPVVWSRWQRRNLSSQTTALGLQEKSIFWHLMAFWSSNLPALRIEIASCSLSDDLPICLIWSLWST